MWQFINVAGAVMFLKIGLHHRGISYVQGRYKNNNNNKRKHCGNNDNRSKRSKWPSDRPNSLKFVLYKENMDTTTACKELGRLARIPFNNAIGYAGMKDKRGVTSQFCTQYQKTPADLAAVSSANGPSGGNTTSETVNVLRVGSFTYTNNCMNLGSLAGRSCEHDYERKKEEQQELVAEARRRWDTRFNQATTKEAAEKSVANSIR
jgi:tRNA(Glu) U13 pseudouridine synthase TruD